MSGSRCRSDGRWPTRRCMCSMPGWSRCLWVWQGSSTSAGCRWGAAMCGRDDLTAERFVPDPFSRDARSAPVQDGGSGAVSPRWRDRVSGAARLSGEDTRPAHRIGRDRGDAGPARRCGSERGAGARRHARGSAAGGLCGAATGGTSPPRS